MIHLGDITKLHGDAIPPVDCITGGSPCQDLSVAGKREGLAGERSGLFMEQIRIVKEMRERDRRNGRTGYLVRPRYMVWENVPGAFSSNKGADFQSVLTEIVKIVEPDAPDVPLPDKGKWPHSGCLYSDMGDWSVAWRLHDAQFWGVPQRRKRIALVADFGGLSAPEILFERKGLSRDPEPRGAEGQGTAESVEGGACEPSAYALEGNGARPSHRGGGYSKSDVSFTLNSVEQHGVAHSFQERAGKPGGARASSFSVNTQERCQPSTANTSGQNEFVPDTAHALSARHDGSPQPDKGNGANIVAVHQNASGEVRDSDVAYTIGTNANASGRNTPLVYDARGNGDGEIATITGDHQSRVTDYTALCVGGNDIAQTLDASYYKGPGSRNGKEREVVATFQNTGRGWWNESDVAATLRCRIGATVRRLTPLECERLQGFPDGWTDIGDWMDSKGKKHKAADSPRYKALGNSIALPFWFWLLRRISAQYERPATLGSLFDGIGGFPLCWERCNGSGTAIWASEIEEFPIAVTKKHFPKEKEDT